jgi:hypothetical protein
MVVLLDYIKEIKERDKKTSHVVTHSSSNSKTKVINVPVKQKEDGEVLNGYNKIVVTASDRDKAALARIKRFGWEQVHEKNL